jgi:molybdopterin-guanine dinucleotide biosynthesis protein A
MKREVLGAIIAGGASSRYGSPKALARVGGIPIVERVLRAMTAVVPDIVMIANQNEIARAVKLPWRSDTTPGAGALGGIYTALLWAKEKERTGILAAACDMPFVSAGLLEEILRVAAERDADVVAPEGGGRRDIEPLCAFYDVSCLPGIRDALQRGDHRMISFHDDVRIRRIPLATVSRFGDPGVLFMNVNTPQDRDVANKLAGAEAP